MGQGIDCFQVKKSRNTLDGVKWTKNVVNDIKIIGVLLQFKDMDLNGLKMLICLADKTAEQLRILHKVRHLSLTQGHPGRGRFLFTAFRPSFTALDKINLFNEL